MRQEELRKWNQEIDTLPILEKIEFVLNKISGKKVFSTSFGIEDQMITDLLYKYVDKVEIFTLDTGRNFEETYDTFQSSQIKYKNFKFKIFYPEEKDVREYVNEYGINGFYRSIENRKQCCYIRKVIPLSRALENANLWITGLRAEQSPNRENMQFLEWDDVHNLVKFNPLLHYTLKEVEAYIKEHQVPINRLYKKGFLSIGCAPCTRALQEGEDFRAGRWWWENGKKECGLHIHKDKNN